MSDGNAIKKLLARVYIRQHAVPRLFFVFGISEPCLSFIRPRHRAILSGFVYSFLSVFSFFSFFNPKFLNPAIDLFSLDDVSENEGND